MVGHGLQKFEGSSINGLLLQIFAEIKIISSTALEISLLLQMWTYSLNHSAVSFTANVLRGVEI